MTDVRCAEMRQLANELAYVSGRVSREADRYLIISAVSALRGAAQRPVGCGFVCPKCGTRGATDGAASTVSSTHHERGK
jgi:hypothetical protein